MEATPTGELPNVADVYRRVIRASRRGRGVRLSPEEARAVAQDGAVEACVQMDELEREEEPQRG